MKKKSLHQVRIEKFMKLAGQECPLELTQASVKIRKLRAKLILEEALEAIAELGVTVSVSDLKINDPFTVDYCSLAKELADLSVVTTGSLSSFGIADVGLLELVDNNNLSKFGPGWSIREDGKLIKPAGFKKLSISKSDL